ncbi:MAG: hypothetical protein JNL69_03935, partial [Bacteroidia bacterium]|nr:hypothetical protein [Bacteroidia bacterium]
MLDSLFYVLETTTLDTTKTNTLNQIAIEFHSNSMYDSALFYIQKAKTLASKTSDQGRLSNSYNTMGSIYESKGNFAESYNCHLKALKIRLQLN